MDLYEYDWKEYAWKVSTYRPEELGEVEFEILSYIANGSSLSTYHLLKMFNKVRAITPAAKTATLYKNIHKRVKRLAQLKLIEGIEGNFKRGARFYRASTYGLISYAGRVITESCAHIKHNKKDIVIQCLLLQFFEEKTIDSFPREICDYLYDCCSVTISICREHWNKIKQYNIEDILPSDEVIQEYMAHLDGKEVGQSILNEITQYEKRLLRKYQSSESLKLIYHQLKMEPPASKKGRLPPFPLDYMYDNIVCKIQYELEAKIKSLAYTLVTRLGEIVTSSTEESYALGRVLAEDYQFFKLITHQLWKMKKNLDRGWQAYY
jgi:hypothetical protein